MIKVSVIKELLESLEIYRLQLESMRPSSLRELTEDTLRYWAVLHGLQIAVQHVVDVGGHILAGKQLASPTDYREIITELGRNKVIPWDFAERIKGMAGFRNIVVHRYLSVDPGEVWKLLQDHLSDFAVFADHVQGYLEREGIVDAE